MPGIMNSPATRVKLRPVAAPLKIKLEVPRSIARGSSHPFLSNSPFLKPAPKKPQQNSLFAPSRIRGSLNPKFLSRYRELELQVKVLKEVISGGIQLKLFHNSLEALKKEKNLRKVPAGIKEVRRLEARLAKLKKLYRRARSGSQVEALGVFIQEAVRFRRDLGKLWNRISKG